MTAHGRAPSEQQPRLKTRERTCKTMIVRIVHDSSRSSSAQLDLPSDPTTPNAAHPGALLHPAERFSEASQVSAVGQRTTALASWAAPHLSL